MESHETTARWQNYDHVNVITAGLGDDGLSCFILVLYDSHPKNGDRLPSADHPQPDWCMYHEWNEKNVLIDWKNCIEEWILSHFVAA